MIYNSDYGPRPHAIIILIVVSDQIVNDSAYLILHDRYEEPESVPNRVFHLYNFLVAHILAVKFEEVLIVGGDFYI